MEECISNVCTENNITGITDRQSSGGSPQKSLHERVLVMIWFLATQDKYASIADRFGMSESTACTAVRNLFEFISDNLLQKFVVWSSAEECHEIADIYYESKGFPGVIGMLDGSHIPIEKPPVRGVDYYNRKDFYSVVLQAVVREDMRFTDIFCGYPGKVHDARVLRKSPLFQTGQHLCRDSHILGDSAYPNLPWLLTPFRDNGHLTDIQKGYNKIHSSIRCNVERAFGILKGRFPRLRFIYQKDIKTIVHTVISACILHNICIISRDENLDFLNDNVVPTPDFNNLHREEYDQNVLEDGAIKRLRIAHQLVH